MVSHCHAAQACRTHALAPRGVYSFSSASLRSAPALRVTVINGRDCPPRQFTLFSMEKVKAPFESAIQFRWSSACSGILIYILKRLCCSSSSFLFPRAKQQKAMTTKWIETKKWIKPDKNGEQDAMFTETSFYVRDADLYSDQMHLSRKVTLGKVLHGMHTRNFSSCEDSTQATLSHENTMSSPLEFVYCT